MPLWVSYSIQPLVSFISKLFLIQLMLCDVFFFCGFRFGISDFKQLLLISSAFLFLAVWLSFHVNHELMQSDFLHYFIIPWEVKQLQIKLIHPFR